MKLVLASQGFTTPEIAEAVSDLVGKPLPDIRIAIINEAYAVLPCDKDKRWMIRELSNIAEYIGGNIDFINLRAYDKEEIRERLYYADLIYLVGGKQFVLPTLFKQTGFDILLKEMIKEKVVMGTSAGANVLGRQIESSEYWEKRYGVDKKEIANRPLGLVNFNIIPHYLRKDHQEWNQAFLKEVLKDNPFLIYALTDTQALLYDNGQISFVGGKPEAFGRKES